MIVPKKLAQGLIVIVVGLLISHIAMKGLKYLGGYEIPNLIRLFDLDEENNLPTWYSSSALLLCSLLLVTIGLAKKRDRDRYAFHWQALSAIFLYLSIDEAASIHEMAVQPMRSMLPRYTSGYLYYSWVIPGGIFVVTLFLMGLRFLINLPAYTRHLFLLAGVMYVGGALGIEMISAKYNTVYGYEGFTFALIVAAEEGCEMFGIVIFIYALSSYIALHIKNVVLIENEEREVTFSSIPTPVSTSPDALPQSLLPSETKAPLPFDTRLL